MPRVIGKAKAERSFNLRLDPSVHLAVRRRAFEKEVSMNQLVNDILTLWILATPDPSDSRYGPISPPKEIYPGYLDEILFTVPSENHVVE